MRLKDKVAWVTGAGSGIGSAIATGFAREGANVVYSDIDVESALSIGRRSGVSDEQWMAQYVNVSDRSSVEACAKTIVDRFGRIDICVANAGITIRKSFLELTDDDFDSVMSVNARGVFLCSQVAARHMVFSGGGVILHIASQTAVNARVNLVAYGASKGAVTSMTRHMALELGIHHIRVNAISPGTIRTNLTSYRLQDSRELETDEGRTLLKRIGEPDDVVGAAIFLASDEASFITGSNIFVDGGETVW